MTDPASRWAAPCLAALLLAPIAAAAAAAPIRLDVDLTEAPQRIVHARLTMPVERGPLTLLYPKWIPGEHGPTGPIADLAGLELSAGGAAVPWQRDPLDMFTFHAEVPPESSSLEIRLDYLMPSATGMFSTGPASSAELAVLSWNTVLLYPAGSAADELIYQASLELPPGWELGTALPVAHREGTRVEFTPVSLTTLVDSPVAAGAHHRVFTLADVPPHRLHVVADGVAALEMTPETLGAYRQLVTEGLALFGAHHYRAYDFLLTLSDHVDSFGLEHHESSDNRLPERSLIDPDLLLESAGLLPHEFVHSWNAKYRRPEGLATPHFQTPMQDDLLWVYEGLTSYLGEVLTARSGLWTPEHTRESLALIAAGLAHRPGRAWRPLADTTRAAQVLYGARQEWSAWRRGVDFYDEGVLLWLEADTVIRKATGDERSLDDFCRHFYGGASGPPEVRRYSYDELLAALGSVAPHDWRGFFGARVASIRAEAPLAGVIGSGWKLAYSEEMNAQQRVAEKANDTTDLRFSLGLLLRHKKRDPEDGRVLDTIPGMPAVEAGIAPGMKLVAVNGRAWSPEILREAVRAAEAGSDPIELLVVNADFYRTHRIHYHGGERYPHLVREATRPDILSDILRPHGRQ